MTGDGLQRLPETLANQVLARAAQLDASDRMSVSIPDLRAAAIEAGISSSALDQALTEMASAQAVSMKDASVHREQPRPTRRWRRLALITVVIALLGATAGVLRLLVPPQSEPETPTIRVPVTR
jgi:hypothetical protein